MSYCRFTEGDVYAYDSWQGGVQFYVSGGRRDLDRLCRTYNEAYEYARTLRDQYGLDVPSYAIEALKTDAIEEAEQIAKASKHIGYDCQGGLPEKELSAEEWHDEYLKVAVLAVNLTEELDELQQDNTELRELVHDWWAFAVGGADSLPDWNAQQADLESRMYELGVEAE